MMTKEYIVYRDSILEALNHLDEFETKMDKFTTENPQYSYNVNVSETSDGLWEVKVKVKKDEQINVGTT